MVSATDPSSFATGESVTATGYYKDGTGLWTSLSIADTVAEIGSTGIYEITISASEMNHDKIIVKFTSSGGQDTYTRLDLDTNGIDDVKTDTAAILSDTGTDGVALSTATKNAIADHVIRRNYANVRASSDGDTVDPQSLIGGVAKLVCKVVESSNTLTVYHEDGTTSFYTQTLTPDATASLVTAQTGAA